MEKEKKKIESIVTSAASNVNLLAILNKLFVKNGDRKENSIADKNSFDRYFSLSLLPNEITSVEFESCFFPSYTYAGETLINLNKRNSSALKSKILDKFNNYAISTSEELKNTLDVMILLYQSVIESKSQADLLDGLNFGNVRSMIFDIYNKAKIEEDTRRKIFSEILTAKRDSYVHMSFLISVDSIFFSNDGNQSGADFQEFRKIQILYLKRTIEKKDINEAIQIMQQARGFIRVRANTDIFLQVDEEWFLDKVLMDNKEFISSNLLGILDSIKKTISTNSISESKEFARKLIIQTFHSIQFLLQFNLPTINDNVEEILEYYDDNPYKTFDNNFIFIQQKPININFPDYNDHIYPNTEKPGIFDLIEDYNSLKITIDPLKTPFWRFGFRFSISQDFPLICDNQEHDRHIFNYPFIHVGTGYRDINREWHADNKLTLAYYKAQKKDNSDLTFEELFADYNNEKIILQFNYDDKDTLQFFVKRGIITSKVVKFTGNFNKYRYYNISAWYDANDFRIATKIKFK
jgi:hypothetical protein